LGEVDLFTAPGAIALLVELVGEDFVFLTAFGALARKRLQFLELLEAGAMTGSGHFFAPLPGLRAHRKGNPPGEIPGLM
jgi:hypothetical protein